MPTIFDMHWAALACGALVALPATSLAQHGEPPAPGAPAGIERASEAETAGASATRTAERSMGPLTLGPLHLAMFVDAYAAYQTSGKGTLATRSGHRAFSGQGSTLRAENGLALSFLGIDAQYDTGQFGVVANLRFGPAATIFHRQSSSESDATYGVEYLTQAYALYRPIEQLELDLGMFLSPFGYEALDSWKNPNYTISALYVYGQPNWHMGFRATWQASDDLTLMALVINGANNISETQQSSALAQAPAIGGSIAYDLTDALSLSIGGFAATDAAKNDDGGFDAFGDFVAAYEQDALRLAFNADYIFTKDGAPSGKNRHFWGGSLTAGYRFTEVVAIAARAEYLRDRADYDGHDLFQLVTGTVTLDLQPLPRLPYLIVRWENRWENSNQRIFGADSRGTEETEDDTYRRSWFESVLGVVVTTDP